MAEKMKPGVSAGLRDAKACKAGNSENSITRGPRKAARVLFEAETGPAVLRLSGRLLWTLRVLVAAGRQGVSALDCPALRLAAYVHRLRRRGIAIETVREEHGGDFPGFHARYRLAQPVAIEGGAA